MIERDRFLPTGGDSRHVLPEGPGVRDPGVTTLAALLHPNEPFEDGRA